MAQLTTQAEHAPEGQEWLHEIKYDGYRLFPRIEHGKTQLLTRNGLDWSTKFPALVDHLTRLPVRSAVLDGEIVHLEADGRTSFSGLQDKVASGETDELVFYAFDLL